MEKEQIAETVQECGERAEFLAGSPIAPAGSFVNVPCMFPPGHLGDHSWENLKHEHDNIRKPFQCHDCGGYVVGGGCTCSLEVKRKRWENTVPPEQRGTGNKIL